MSVSRDPLYRDSLPLSLLIFRSRLALNGEFQKSAPSSRESALHPTIRTTPTTPRFSIIEARAKPAHESLQRIQPDFSSYFSFVPSLPLPLPPTHSLV